MVLFLYPLALAAYEAIAAPAVSSQPQALFNSVQNTTNYTPSAQFSPYDVLSRIATLTPLLSPVSPTSSSFADISSSQFTSNNLSGTTVFVTEIETAFETTTAAATTPSATTTAVAVTATATATSITSPSLWDSRTQWAVPPQMTDLSAFNVTYFPSGQRNLDIVSRVPANDIAPTSKSMQVPGNDTRIRSTMLQLVYPAHSVNPGSKPEGGADFYATPINLSGARNVTLRYSVFFPADFDWVKGGKLPGLFGGHTGCSGGSSARDCFSTRLMWRPLGVGELYLYAPKDKQSGSLCDDAESVCDATYGFSIGRGTFNFTAGNWTHLQQNVVLNTPGQNDGIFRLLVDGRLTINRTDILYRDVVLQARRVLSGSKTSAATASPVMDVAKHILGERESIQQPVEFLGLFFSTFFGGHGSKYATPKQQYAWFKDFAITRHD